jgi:hypothetical protein
MKTLKSVLKVVRILYSSSRSKQTTDKTQTHAAANSTATANFKRNSMFDGSLDDMIGCSVFVLPAAAVNGIRVLFCKQITNRSINLGTI